MIRRTREPAWRRRATRTIHAALLSPETLCGLVIFPELRVTAVFADDFWDLDADRPQPDACRRRVAAVRWFLYLFKQDIEMRHPQTVEHWRECSCGESGSRPPAGAQS